MQDKETEKASEFVGSIYAHFKDLAEKGVAIPAEHRDNPYILVMQALGMVTMEAVPAKAACWRLISGGNVSIDRGTGAVRVGNRSVDEVRQQQVSLPPIPIPTLTPAPPRPSGMNRVAQPSPFAAERFEKRAIQAGLNPADYGEVLQRLKAVRGNGRPVLEVLLSIIIELLAARKS